jgi:hypothetical protein
MKRLFLFSSANFALANKIFRGRYSATAYIAIVA